MRTVTTTTTTTVYRYAELSDEAKQFAREVENRSLWENGEAHHVMREAVDYMLTQEAERTDGTFAWNTDTNPDTGLPSVTEPGSLTYRDLYSQGTNPTWRGAFVYTRDDGHAIEVQVDTRPAGALGERFDPELVTIDGAPVDWDTDPALIDAVLDEVIDYLRDVQDRAFRAMRTADETMVDDDYMTALTDASVWEYTADGELVNL